MSPLVLEKPVFTKDQVVSATEASKSLSAVRKRAKRAPQFIADHNDIDTVIIDYAAYEEMYGALQYLRELELDRIAADRIKNGPHEFVPFEDALTPEEPLPKQLTMVEYDGTLRKKSRSPDGASAFLLRAELRRWLSISQRKRPRANRVT